jgi:hypothetical protein
MPNNGSPTPRDLTGRLVVLAVACAKCGRAGRYRVPTIAALLP